MVCFYLIFFLVSYFFIFILVLIRDLVEGSWGREADFGRVQSLRKGADEK